MVNNNFPTSFQFEAIFNEAAIGILVTNASFEILISNHFADQLFGFEQVDCKFLVFERVYFLMLMNEFEAATAYFLQKN